MPQRPPPKLEDQMTLFSENNHGKSVVVEQVGDEIISESEVWHFNLRKKYIVVHTLSEWFFVLFFILCNITSLLYECPGLFSTSYVS